MATDGDTNYDRYKSWSDEDLIRASTVESSDYQPGALTVIRAEIARWKVPVEAEKSVVDRAAQERESQKNKLTGMRGFAPIESSCFWARINSSAAAFA